MNEQVKTDLTVISNLEQKPYITKYLSTDIYNEELCLLSILTLPYSVARYSRAFSHLTTVYEATNLMEGTHGLSLFKMLKNSSAINTVYVGGENDEPFVNKKEINNYSLIGNKNIDNLLQNVLKKELDISGYLHSIPYFTKGVGFSIYKVCRQLEPFEIYYDRLKTDQYLVLNEVLEKRIKKYKRVLKKNNSAFNHLEREISKL